MRQLFRNPKKKRSEFFAVIVGIKCQRAGCRSEKKISYRVAEDFEIFKIVIARHRISMNVFLYTGFSEIFKRETGFDKVITSPNQ